MMSKTPNVQSLSAALQKPAKKQQKTWWDWWEEGHESGELWSDSRTK
jgi:hypothetical protein